MLSQNGRRSRPLACSRNARPFESLKLCSSLRMNLEKRCRGSKANSSPAGKLELESSWNSLPSLADYNLRDGIQVIWSIFLERVSSLPVLPQRQVTWPRQDFDKVSDQFRINPLFCIVWGRLDYKAASSRPRRQERMPHASETERQKIEPHGDIRGQCGFDIGASSDSSFFSLPQCFDFSKSRTVWFLIIEQ